MTGPIRARTMAPVGNPDAAAIRWRELAKPVAASPGQPCVSHQSLAPSVDIENHLRSLQVYVHNREVGHAAPSGFHKPAPAPDSTGSSGTNAGASRR
jgi:hypothetical protein